MKLLKHKVQSHITKMLPPTFGLIMDGWSMGSQHYNEIFATFVDANDQVQQVLLSCNVAEDFDENTTFEEGLREEEKVYGFSAADWFDTIEDVLNIQYGLQITAENASQTIEFFIGDNCTNKKLSIDTGKNFVDLDKYI